MAPRMPIDGSVTAHNINVVSVRTGLSESYHPTYRAAKLSSEVIRIMRAPEMEKRVLKDGYMLVANTPAQFKSEIQNETATWSRVIRERSIKSQ